MNKIILRFNIIKTNEVFEVIFDQRLTFTENFFLLSHIYPIRFIDDNYIIDPDKKIALKKDVPIKSFNFPNFMTLYLF